MDDVLLPPPQPLVVVAEGPVKLWESIHKSLTRYDVDDRN